MTVPEIVLAMKSEYGALVKRLEGFHVIQKEMAGLAKAIKSLEGLVPQQRPATRPDANAVRAYLLANPGSNRETVRKHFLFSVGTFVQRLSQLRQEGVNVVATPGPRARNGGKTLYTYHIEETKPGAAKKKSERERSAPSARLIVLDLLGRHPDGVTAKAVREELHKNKKTTRNVEHAALNALKTAGQVSVKEVEGVKLYTLKKGKG